MAFLHAPDFLGVSTRGSTSRRLHPELMAGRCCTSRRPATGSSRSSAGDRSTRSTSGWAASTAPRPAPSSRRCPTTSSEAHAGAVALLRWVADVRLPVDAGTARSRHGVRLAAPRATNTRSTRVASSRTVGSTSTWRRSEQLAARAPRAALDGAARPRSSTVTASVTTRPGPLARWMNNADLVPAVDPRGRRRARRGRRSRPTRSAASSCGGSRCSGRSRRRSGSSPRTSPPPAPFVEVPAAPASGTAAPRRPRGILYHRYEIDDDGLIADAVIIPPTSQNQDAIEARSARLRQLATSTSTTTRSATDVNRSSGTTTRASRAPRTSCGSTIDRSRTTDDRDGAAVGDRRRQPRPWRRRRRADRVRSRPRVARCPIPTCSWSRDRCSIFPSAGSPPTT